MNGKFPVMSWYIIPVFLSASAPKQDTFAMELVLSSAMMFGLPSIRMFGGMTSTQSVSLCNSTWGGDMIDVFLRFGVVLFIP